MDYPFPQVLADYPRHIRESLSRIRVARTARQDARRSGKGDAEHALIEKDASSDFMWNTIINRKGSFRDVM